MIQCQKLSNISERVAAHKAMAIAALRADSSLSTRLARYNHHMERARALELLGRISARKGGVK